ncbi:MAG: tetratricopeptide repeat protein [bacterium]
MFLLLTLFALSIPRLLVAQTIPLDALLRGARIHYSQGRFERALETFRQAYDEYGTTADPATLAEIHIWLGLSRAQLRQFDDAARDFALALDLDAGTAERLRKDEGWAHWSWTSLVNSARGFYNRDAFDSSLTLALAAVKVDPTRPGAYSLVANSYSALGRHDEMLATAREMLSVNAGSPEAYGLIGLYYLQRPDSLWTGEMKTARWDSCDRYYQLAIDAYEKRYSDAKKAIGEKLGIPAGPRLDEIAATLTEKSRSLDQQVLKDYIEKDLKAGKVLAEVAQHASTLFYAANNLNVACSRAGSAMLRASSETSGPRGDGFRARAESLFVRALAYDPFDFAAMFNLGIAQYQSQNDSLAEQTFQRVIAGTIVPLTGLPAGLRSRLAALVQPGMLADGYLQLDGSMQAEVDSVLYELGNQAAGFAWLYFPALRGRAGFTIPTDDDAAGMFLSLESPPALENIYLLMGVTQTSIGLAREKAAKGSGREKLELAIVSLNAALGVNPVNAEAWQNLVHCYRETGQEKKALEAARQYQKLSGGK